MGCRGYLVGNGFPRVLRHSPTTSIFLDHVNTTLFLCNMITLIKRHGCIMFTYSYKCYYGS